MAEAGSRADTSIGRMLTPRSVAIVGVSARPGSSGQALLRTGRLMTACPQITELDINPLLACPDGVTALDALIVCSEPSGQD